VVAIAAAGCGGSSKRAVQVAPAKPPKGLVACHGSGSAKDRARIQSDLRLLRRSRTHAQASAGTDRFLLDLGRSKIPLSEQNRLIDFAISATLGKCQDCFQALEAARPIPALKAHACA
jgi:hypothetical protein